MTTKILGYTKDGKPIHPIKSGMMATACIISCIQCHKVIRGMGGPSYGAKCPDCFHKPSDEAKEPQC